VDSLERAAEKGPLDGTEVLMFTDNTTAEAAFFRESSKSRELHKLVLRLRVLEMKLGVRIWVVHVSGSRMIMTGIDGVSRGDMDAGVMAGADMLSFIPLNLSAMHQSSKLTNWLQSWICDGANFLEPWDVCVVASSSSGSGSFGVAGQISSQASNVCACDSDPAVTHSFVEKTVGKNYGLDVDSSSGLSCLASRQPGTVDSRDLTSFIEIFPLAFQEHFDYP